MKKILTAAVFMTVIAALVFGTYRYSHSQEYRIQKEIADNIIRFHIRAASDSEEDQRLKLKVKDAVVKYMKGQLADADSLDEARNILYDDTDSIRELALKVIKDEGYAYDVNVYFERSYFPMKTYGDMSFPPGEYEAFRVDIGEADGKNWWCVLFPPLCFVDQTYTIVPDDTKNMFRNVLSDEAYDAITMHDLENDDYQVGFKYLTFLDKFFQ
ncbi:MAG: stage II sporulation protein R [Butyrivibrio sp.]